LPGVAFAALEPHLKHAPQTPHDSGEGMIDACRRLKQLLGRDDDRPGGARMKPPAPRPDTERLTVVTRPPRAHFFGYSNKSPWDASGRRVHAG